MPLGSTPEAAGRPGRPQITHQPERSGPQGTEDDEMTTKWKPTLFTNLTGWVLCCNVLRPRSASKSAVKNSPRSLDRWKDQSPVKHPAENVVRLLQTFSFVLRHGHPGVRRQTIKFHFQLGCRVPRQLVQNTSHFQLQDADTLYRGIRPFRSKPHREGPSASHFS